MSRVMVEFPIEEAEAILKRLEGEAMDSYTASGLQRLERAVDVERGSGGSAPAEPPTRLRLMRVRRVEVGAGEAAWAMRIKQPPTPDCTEFTMTADHLNLLRNAYVTFYLINGGAPAIDGKRPYGNSDIPMDIADLLGWELVENRNGADLTVEQEEMAMRLHSETEIALQVVLKTGEFRPGRYVRSKPWERDWRRAVAQGEAA